MVRVLVKFTVDQVVAFFRVALNTAEAPGGKVEAREDGNEGQDEEDEADAGHVVVVVSTARTRRDQSLTTN